MKLPWSLWLAAAGLAVYGIVVMTQAVSLDSSDTIGFVRALVRAAGVWILAVALVARVRSAWSVAIIATSVLLVLAALALFAASVLEDVAAGWIVPGRWPLVVSSLALLTAFAALLLPQTRAALNEQPETGR